MWKARAVSMLQRVVQSQRSDRRTATNLTALAATSSSAVLLGYLYNINNQNERKEDSVLPSKHGSSLLDELSVLPFTDGITPSNTTHCQEAHRTPLAASLIGRRETLRQMQQSSTKASLKSRYDVDWRQPLGVGSYGKVYLATNRETGQKVALKKIAKKYTSDSSFQREMNALLHMQTMAGGHPNICSLIEHFDEGDHYYLILDLMMGGELFDHLVEQGAYTEQDASRLVREIASALAFLHGLDTTHGDLKPENLMLTTKSSTDSVIKLVDFGCAQVGTDEVKGSTMAGKTLAYCPPEQLKKDANMHPSMDLWALGVILYIMLTGVHPFDLNGNASDDEVAELVLTGKQPPPLRNSPITVHLSKSAIELMEMLMTRDPNMRITALELLEHPWVKGETASKRVLTDIDKKLSLFRRYKSRIEKKVFADIVEWSDESEDSIATRISLIERSFRALDPGQKGYITTEDMRKATGGDPHHQAHSSPEAGAPLSLSGFSHMMAENMKNKYFPMGYVVYRQGDIGNHMYFINSGAVLVESSGASVKRGAGDFFGEGALLHPQKIRSATIRCATPVHALEVSRDFFEKNLANRGLLLLLHEKDKIRKRNRAKMILRLQENLRPMNFKKGDKLFHVGESGDDLYLVEAGLIDVLVEGKKVLTATPGNICGEHTVITKKSRNSTAICASDNGCQAYQMKGHDFRKLMNESPEVKNSLRDLCLRRDFKKAVVMRLQKEFPYDNPRQAFDAVKDPDEDAISLKAVGRLLRELDKNATDEDAQEVLERLDFTKSGAISFDEFKKIFIADIRKSEAI